jgi:hypothetical protein
MAGSFFINIHDIGGVALLCQKSILPCQYQQADFVVNIGEFCQFVYWVS